jgi:murein DD-endopeptidase MepM/ murein hydrolase activator NlpD
MSRTLHQTARVLTLGTALLVVAGCASRQPAERASVEFKGTNPAAGSPAALSPQAVAPVGPAAPGGIVSYQGYQAAVARQGDTVASVAQRIGLSASELGAYNGLQPDQPLRAGDELVLPPKPGGYGGAPAPAGETATQIAAADPLLAPATPAYEPPEAAIEAAPLEGAPAAGTPQQGGGWTAWSPAIAAAAIERAEGFDEQGNLGAPPSADEPLPPAPQRPAQLASPQLGQYQTRTPATEPPAPASRPVETITTPAEQAEPEAAPEPAPAPEPVELAAAPAQPADGLSLIRPAAGPIVLGFQQGAGRARNDGVDFASPAGAPVVAAADGEVALVSQSLGGLGTIVLVRHPGDYLTVYGRIDRVTVQKGDIVSQGQQIGVVAANAQPRMHFEVRKGAESLDPERFF